MSRLLFISLFTFLCQQGFSQTFTMSNKCYRLLKQAAQYNIDRKYDSALNAATQMTSDCKTKDARYKGQTEKAHALNALGMHSEAMDASNIAIKANKNWIAAYFERALANAGLGMMKESTRDYETIIRLSAKNRDQASRSTIYAMVSNILFKQGQYDSARYYIEQAYRLDPRPDYYIQLGDMYYSRQDYENAFVQYDKAVSLGKADAAMYHLRYEQRLRIYQKKYETTNITELAKKMKPEEKKLCCAEVDKLRSLGEKSFQTDLVYTYLCE